jgi:hypothetical protein
MMKIEWAPRIPCHLLCLRILRHSRMENMYLIV